MTGARGRSCARVQASESAQEAGVRGEDATPANGIDSPPRLLWREPPRVHQVQQDSPSDFNRDGAPGEVALRSNVELPSP